MTRTLLRIQQPLSSRDAREFCATPPAGEHRFVAILEATGEPVGIGTVTAHGAMASIGYSVLPAQWRRGLGTQFAGLLLGFACERLAAVEVRATALADNVASARGLAKLGFAVADGDAREIDSRGDERRVVRWSLRSDA